MPIQDQINKTYYRVDAEGFSLAPRGQEQNIEFVKCNFYTDRKEGTQPKYITQTYSVGNLESTLSNMIIPEGGDISVLRGPGKSIHYIIDNDEAGTIYQLVPDSKRPWASGIGNFKEGSKLNRDISQAQMKNDMNNYEISIMSINDGKTPLTPNQIQSNLELTSYLSSTYEIKTQKVIGLADWTPGVHIAPGPYFPWQDFANAGYGLWTNIARKEAPEVVISFKDKNFDENIDHLQQELHELAHKLTDGLGMMITEPNRQIVNDSGENLTVYGQNPSYAPLDTLKIAARFNLHYFGQEILNSPLKDVYDTRLWTDSSDLEALKVFGEWNENSQNILNALVDGVELVGSVD